MNIITAKEISEYVEAHIGEFHSAKLSALSKLKLQKILLRKNPYLFKAKNILTSEVLVKTLLDAHLSSQEETMFGDFLENVAIFINSKIYGGTKSAAEGIDLEFEKEGIRYIVAIKSGPNWGNSGQIKKMKENFRQARRILNTSRTTQNVVAINGCCYGRENTFQKEEYQKLCGQRFWEFISGNSNLYIEIIEPLGFKAKEKNEEFLKSYSKIVNLFTAEFNKNYCQDGSIEWDKLVKLNSSSETKEPSTKEVLEPDEREEIEKGEVAQE